MNSLGLEEMRKTNGILLVHKEDEGEAFIKGLARRNILFTCTIGTTETAKIPGISAAGSCPELTDYTPPADAELLLTGKCRCLSRLPLTPEGVPTPALITMSALELASVPSVVASGGLKIAPHIPFLDLGGRAGGDMRTGEAVAFADEVVYRAEIAGRSLAKIADCLVVGESIPGGTTTALGVLLAMGVDAQGKVSSSMPNSPHELKIRIVEESMRISRIGFGGLASDPLKAISCLGDPVMPAFAGLVLGAAERIPVLMAGGTQMGAVLAVIKHLRPSVLDGVIIGTTRWIIADKKAHLEHLIAQIADVPIIAADLDFRKSRFEGLRAYEAGAVKEGVGAGGAAIAAMAKSEGSVTKEVLLKEVEKNYERLVGQR